MNIYITKIFTKWHFNPDIMTTEKLISSSEIPMPAMTVCTPLLGRIENGNFSEILDLVSEWKI